MRARTLVVGGIASLWLALISQVGCGDGGGAPLPPTGGAGIPGLRGPIGPPKGKAKGAVGKRPVTPKQGPQESGAAEPVPKQ